MQMSNTESGEKPARHYMVSALKRRYADRVPTTILIGPFCSRLISASVREILTDAKKSAMAHMAFWEKFRPDSLIIYNDIYLEAEAVGCKLEFPDDEISRPKAPLLREKGDLARCKIPDPKRDGRIPYFLEVLERVSSQLPETTPIGLGHSGPWNIANHLMGTKELLLETRRDPQFVHSLMRFATDVVKSMGQAIIKAGFSPSMGEATASCSLISPRIYREFIKPYHRELCAHFREMGAYTSVHICGFIDPIMEDLLEIGANLISMDAPSSLEGMINISSGRVVVMGNVPTGLFATGTREEMENAVKRCIDIGAPGSGYILASGCEIPLSSTEDRIQGYFHFARDYGRRFMRRLREERPELFEE
jgi:uroporphyrinogen decarboxylase